MRCFRGQRQISSGSRTPAAHAALLAHARVPSKTGLTDCRLRSPGGMQFACLTCTFLTDTLCAAGAFPFGSSVTCRNIRGIDMDGFDYSAPAELFPTRSRKGNRPMAYRRFAKAAEAIRFAIEELSPTHLLGAHLEVEEQRIRSRRDTTAVRQRGLSVGATRPACRRVLSQQVRGGNGPQRRAMTSAEAWRRRGGFRKAHRSCR